MGGRIPRGRRRRAAPVYPLAIAVQPPPAGADSALEAVTWNLAPLLAEADGPDGLLADAVSRASAFADGWRGRLARCTSAELEAAMDELAEITDLVGRAASYAALWFATDTTDPQRGALLQRVQERATEVETALLFFDLEWAALDDDRVDTLLADEGLEHYRHHLRRKRRYRPHLLSEPEERILAEKQVTGAAAWARLFEELTSALEVELRDGDRPEGAPTRGAPLDVALSRLTSPDQEVRAATAAAVTDALAPGLRTRASVLNTLLQDKAIDDRLRSYPHWLAARNLANETTDESVQALLAAVRRRYALPQRWYRLKARLLGLDRLKDFDRMASVVADEPEVGWTEARETVLDAYTAFSPELGALVRRFFDESWIDAPAQPGKRGGAFCAYAVPSVHPYVLLNFTYRAQDVLTLAHELGHGVHAALARPQGIFHHHTPLTMAETASVFGETLVFERLLAAERDPERRLALLAENIERAIATVFRQTAMNRFEHLVHTTRRSEGELSVDRFGDLWEESQAEMLGEAVEITPGYRSWWSYVPHFVSAPGYVYAYAYGQLLALSIYKRYTVAGEAFVPAYLELLAAGGSRSPEDLAAIVGIDLNDPGFWDAGLELVEQQLRDAEAAARESGRIGADD